MIITLNLASYTSRKYLIKEKINILIKDVILMLLFIMLINSIYIFIAYTFLNKNYKEIKNLKESIQMHNQPFNQEIADINKKIKIIDGAQKDYVKWSEKIIQLNEIVPANIKLTRFKFDKNNNSFEIFGWALKRNDFLNFKENLEKNSMISELNSPLSNLLLQENINFSLNGKLNYENQ